MFECVLANAGGNVSLADSVAAAVQSISTTLYAALSPLVSMLAAHTQAVAAVKALGS
jgi:hypothetical protein